MAHEATLVDRLRAAIEERLALAEAAARELGNAPRWWVEDDSTVAVPATDPATGATRGVFTVARTQDVGRPVVEHIAANDPATVIARCKVDLAILAIHRRVDDDPDHGVTEAACYGCAFNAIEEYLVPDAKDCPMVRLLAEGYGLTEEP